MPLCHAVDIPSCGLDWTSAADDIFQLLHWQQSDAIHALLLICMSKPQTVPNTMVLPNILATDSG